MDFIKLAEIYTKQQKGSVIVTKTVLPVRLYLLIIIIIIPAFLKAQLTAPGMSAERYTAYPSSPGVKDQIFIFCKSTPTQTGTLSAASPGGTGPFNFSWFMWSDITGSFSTFIRTDLSVSSSTVTNLGEGGYRVRITDGGTYDTSLVGWVHLDKPFAEAKLQNYTCDYVALSGKAVADTFYYRDPLNGNPVKLRNAVKFLWSSTPSSVIPYPGIELNPVTFTPPLEDVVYKLHVTDSFTCDTESSFPYTSIHVKADFTLDPETGEAPLTVNFTDKSVRASVYRWEFGDDTISDLSNPGSHIYYQPGEYKVKLIIESDLLCVDSMIFEKIVVEPSALSIPNVFTPDGDGINDLFVVESKSLRSIVVEIFARSGIMVYSFRGEGEALSEWQGWDGRINNSSREAVPGVYFYIIRARGWDNKVYDGVEYRGFLHLYR